MRVHFLIFLCLFAFGTGASGCSTAKKAVIKPAEDVLIYPLSFDLTYLRTMQALQDVPDWELQETEKEQGVIKVRNINYSSWNDADKRLIVVLVKYLNANQTSVQLASESQTTIGGQDLLNQISAYMKKEI